MLKSLLSRQPFKIAFALTLALIALVVMATAGMYLRALNTLKSIDLNVRTVSGAQVTADAPRVFVGKAVTRDDLVEYLSSIGYDAATNPGTRATFLLEGQNTLHVFPQFPEFKPLSLKFAKGKIVEVSSPEQSSAPVDPVEPCCTLEPEPLLSFVTTLSEKGREEYQARRYVLQWDDLEFCYLVDTIPTQENRTYWEDNGISYKGLAAAILFRAGKKLGLTKKNRGGASTISAQTVKNLYLDWSHSYWRKFDEAFLAVALERSLNSKQALFTLYVNHIYFGRRGNASLYGVAAASEAFFNKRNVRDLTLGEAATLTCAIKSPKRFLPWLNEGNYQRITKARDDLLDQLPKLWPEKYTQIQIEQAKQEPVKFADEAATQERPLDVLTKPAIDVVLTEQPELVELKQKLTPQEYAGLKIRSTIDANLTRAAHSICNVWLPQLAAQYPPSEDCQDHQDGNHMLASLVALNPQTGEIITLFGEGGGAQGIGLAKYALTAMRPPASIIKPFWLALAFDRTIHLADGSILTPTSRLEMPGNGAGGQNLRSLNSRECIASSNNAFAEFLVKEIGPENCIALFAKAAGKKLINPTSNLAIGLDAGMELTALRAALMFSALARNGTMVEPVIIKRLTLDGRDLEIASKPAKLIFSAEAAFQARRTMEAVLGKGPDGAYGTGRNLLRAAGLSPEIAIAAKSGSGPSAAWFVSVSPKLVLAVNVTYMCNGSIQKREHFEGASTAGKIWVEMMKAVKQHRPDLLAGQFEVSANLLTRQINLADGCLYDGPGSSREYFIKGTEPTCVSAESNP